MRSATLTALALAGVLAIADVNAQQPPAQPPAGGQRMGGGGDAARKVPGGGISAPGWQGKIDAKEASAGAAIDWSKFEMKGSEITIATGPAAVYWSPANNIATGDYTVSATFSEPAYMSANSHGHPYGVFIAGNKLDTATPSLLYCATYGDGRYILRAFPESFAPGGSRRAATSEAVKKVEKGQPVTQEISMSLKGSRVSCTINGTEVGSWSKDDLVGEGKLESIQGIAGIRVAHNVDVNVSNFKVTKH